MKKAFTLIELLIVIGIIAVLMSALLVAMSGNRENAMATQCLANLRGLASAYHAAQAAGKGFAPYTPDYDGDKGERSWISSGHDGSFISPYSTSTRDREHSYTNGLMWAYMNGNRKGCTCPLEKERDPAWSYVMNSNSSLKEMVSIARKDRTLLFAELPFLEIAEVQKTTDVVTATASDKNNPIIEIGEEAIGFNHQNKHGTYAHVCFVDGHVEKIELPAGADTSNLKEFTQMLCGGNDDYYVNEDGKFEKLK